MAPTSTPTRRHPMAWRRPTKAKGARKHAHCQMQGSAHVAAPKTFRILHFNDVYNISAGKSDPVGGAARFITALNEQITAAEGSDTIVTFAGDAFSPAPLTPYTDGEEMPPVLNAAKVDVACVGNHEVDKGLDVMKKRISETNFPWLMSNLNEKATGKPLGGVNRTCIIEKSGIKFGFFGLASMDWVEALSAVRPDDLVYTDTVEAADVLSVELREQGCDVIIAVVHVFQPDDEHLANEAKDVDLVLGGHDHVVWVNEVNGRWAVKAGTDFKNFAVIDLSVSADKTVDVAEPVIISVTEDITPDPDMEKYVHDALEPLRDPRLDVALATCTTMLDGRFISIRTQETGLGNLVVDSISAYTKAPNCMYNSGSYRADNLDPPSPWTQRELEAVMPFNNKVVVVRYSGDNLLGMIENSVSQYPLLAGRFMQVSGIKFSFDPTKAAGERVTTAMATDNDGNLVNITPDKSFNVAINEYTYAGGDGYTPGSEDDLLSKDDVTGPQMVANYLQNSSVDIDGDGEKDLPVVSPTQEGRITCLFPDEELVKQYPYDI